ncbi:MAG: HAMP domain-containing histidine kinase [Patescibacteria group bacterium]|nr:HAMP domain-containing histidine kinase [Patescibacteria group bacterium]
MGFNLNFNSFRRNIFGLKSKFRIIIALFLALIFGIVAFILVDNSNQSLTKQVTSQAKAYASLSSKPLIEAYGLYYDSGYLKFREIFNNLSSLNNNISRTQILDLNGNILFDSNFFDVEKPVAKLGIVDNQTLDAIRKDEPTYVGGNNGEIAEIIYPYVDDWGGRQYALNYYISYQEVLKNSQAIRNNIILLAVSFLILSLLLISWLVGRIILDPIEKVHQGALLISQGKLGYEIKVKTKDEVEELAGAVNQMGRNLQKDIEDLEKLDKLKDEFIAIASHNLRTPLTAIAGYLDFFLKRKTGRLNKEQQQYLVNIKENTDSLSELVEDLLSVVHFESGEKGLLRGPTELPALIEAVVKDYQPLALKKGISLTFVSSHVEMPKLKIDTMKIREAVKNLVDNAIKFTSPPAGNIEVGLNLKGKEVVVFVKDNGIGIGKEELKDLFQKFHRGTSVLDYNYVGEGLGLYVAKLIVTAHGGRIWVESALNKGSTFSLSLPLSSQNLV